MKEEFQMSSAAAAKLEDARFGTISPMLSVESVPTSIEYYVKVLGFKVDWSTRSFASVSRDNLSIYLSQGGQGQLGTWVWIGVEGISALYEEYKMSGATIREAPTNYSWAYEMKVEDPNGHVLRFGDEPNEDEPYND